MPLKRPPGSTHGRPVWFRHHHRDKGDPPVEVTLRIPFDREDLVALLYREAEVVSRETDEDGTLVVARVPERHLAWAKDFLARPVRLPTRSGS